MSAPIGSQIVEDRLARIAHLMEQYKAKYASEEIASENAFINFLANFHLVEYSCDKNQRVSLRFFETEHDHDQSIAGRIAVGNLDVSYYSSHSVLAINRSAVSLNGKTLSVALFTPDVLERVIPQARNQRQYSSNK